MPLAVTQAPANPGNFAAHASGREVLRVVIHVEGGSEPGTIAWFKNPNAHVSSHYSISRSGQIFQHVAEKDIAWAQGLPYPCRWVDETKDPRPRVNPNQYCVSIEHEGDAITPWPAEQVAATARLVADICHRYGLPIDRTHVVGHHEIYAGHICPGSGCPLDAIVALAQSAKP